MNTALLVAGGVVLGGFLIWLAIRTAYRQGRAEERGRAADRQGEAARDAREIEDDVAGMPESDLDRELDRTRRLRK